MTSRPFVPAVFNSFVDAIGNTPVILLKGPSERTGCKIYGKGEFMSPGGSVKDRAAKFLIDGLERDGKIQSGGTIVEGTAGNTGIGLTYVANAKVRHDGGKRKKMPGNVGSPNLSFHY